MSENLRYAVLGTGSKANSYIFSDSETTIVVDNGFPVSKFLALVKDAGFDPREIDLIFVTHGHSDHVKGVADLSQKFRIPVYHHAEVDLGKKRCYRPAHLKPRENFKYKTLSLFPFKISHDSPGSMGYHFKLGDKKFTVLTDTGKVTEGMKKIIQRSNVLFLEANYCPQMLEKGAYPQYLKNRISSDFGHLSNDAAVKLLNQIYTENQGGPEQIYFCHLSDKNNSPERLAEVLDKDYKGNVPWVICKKNEMVLGEKF